MEFCSKCGSFLQKTRYGFLCPRCGNKIQNSARTPQAQTAKAPQLRPICVDEGSGGDGQIVHQTCPNCENIDAFRRLTGVFGEHAGVRSERTLEQFRCTKCGHRWTRSK